MSGTEQKNEQQKVTVWEGACIADKIPQQKLQNIGIELKPEEKDELEWSKIGSWPQGQKVEQTIVVCKFFEKIKKTS